jgi:cob(I)alamin adenosyltransferase
MKIATKTGDKGKTSLLIGGRVHKFNCLIILVGLFDELSAAIGVAKAHCPKTGAAFDYYYDSLSRLQQNIIAIMGEVTTAKGGRADYIKKFDFLQLKDLEILDGDVEMLEDMPEIVPTDWVLYGDTVLGSFFDMASKVARRTETYLCEVNDSGHDFRPVIMQWTNRVSDYLYLLARYADFTLEK